MKNLVNQIYTLKNKFILIGLTGKTGSGCSTIADILKEGYIEYQAVNENDKYIQQKKDRIIKNYASKNFEDKNFYIIKPSTIIIMIFIFEKAIFFNEVRELKKLLDENDIIKIKIKASNILKLYQIIKIFGRASQSS